MRDRALIAIAAVAALTACGRYRFDPLDDGGGGEIVDTGVDGPGFVGANQTYIKASNASINDRLGQTLAMAADGNTFVVSALQENSAATGINGNQLDNSAGGSGAGYVFVRSGGSWVQQAYLKASNTQAGDELGSSLAISGDGNTIAIATTIEGSGATGVGGNQADNSAPSAGAVYVFSRSGTTWTQQAYLKASNTGAGDQFGAAVALSIDGDTLAVTALAEDSAATGVGGNQADNSAASSGAAYVFTRSGATWSQQAYLKASNTDASDLLGYSIALSVDGSTLAVGAQGEDSMAIGIDGAQGDNSAASSGAVYVFTRAGSAWSQQAYLKASNTQAADDFGTSVSLAADGNTLLATAVNEDSGATGIGGDQADNAAVDSGAAYVFVRSGATWSQQAYIKASNTEAGDYFGYNGWLSADGSTVVLGAEGEDSGATGIGGNQSDNARPASGAAYVLVRSGTTWVQRSYVKAPNTDLGDVFGDSVALSGDGTVLAVGVQFEDGGSTGVGGDPANNAAADSGAVFLYE